MTSTARAIGLSGDGGKNASPLDWNSIVSYAIRLPGAELSSHYGKPAVKVDGRAMLGTAREEGSFVLHIDLDTKQILLETDPKTFWQTPHYEGWPCLLVRYDSADPERVLTMVQRSWEWAKNLGPPRARAKR
ncbi:MAG: MmcQ/YjbR family DNA-binding protein [Proteobacteria bacterium]|nr:MmcQ/YjbR family DNA-binding protein [Pseudomonadota bacterium]